MRGSANLRRGLPSFFCNLSATTVTLKVARGEGESEKERDEDEVGEG